MNNRALKFVLFLGLLALGWWLGRVYPFEVASFQAALGRYPLALSGILFIALYVATTTFIWFGPKDVLRVSGAVLFGAEASTVFVWAGEMVNALIMFRLSRALGRDYIEQKFRVKPVDVDKSGRGASLIGIMAWRINPFAPFRLLDLGYGLTQVSFRKYFFGIVLVSAVRIFWLQFILAGMGTGFLRGIPAMLEYFDRHPAAMNLSAVYFLMVAVVTGAAVVSKFICKKPG